MYTQSSPPHDGRCRMSLIRLWMPFPSPHFPPQSLHGFQAPTLQGLGLHAGSVGLGVVDGDTLVEGSLDLSVEGSMVLGGLVVAFVAFDFGVDFAWVMVLGVVSLLVVNLLDVILEDELLVVVGPLVVVLPPRVVRPERVVVSLVVEFVVNGEGGYSVGHMHGGQISEK